MENDKELANSNSQNKKDDKNSHESEQIKPEIIEKIKKDPSMVREIFMGIMKSGPAMPPFFDKIDGNHITQALETMDKELKYEYDSKKSGRIFTIILVVIGLIAAWCFTRLFISTNNIDLIKEIAKIGGAAVMGGFGGYGINEARHKKD